MTPVKELRRDKPKPPSAFRVDLLKDKPGTMKHQDESEQGEEPVSDETEN